MQETIGTIGPNSLGTIGLAMKETLISVPYSPKTNFQIGRNGGRRKKLWKNFKKTLGNEMSFPIGEKRKPEQPEDTFYRNAKKLYVAGAEGEDCPLEKEEV